MIRDCLHVGSVPLWSYGGIKEDPLENCPWQQGRILGPHHGWRLLSSLSSLRLSSPSFIDYFCVLCFPASVLWRMSFFFLNACLLLCSPPLSTHTVHRTTPSPSIKASSDITSAINPPSSSSGSE